MIVTGTVTAQSSIALKDNVETITDALAKVMNLRGVEFDYKANGKHQIGVVAEEVEQVVPCVIDETNGIKSVDLGNLVAVLIEAVKDLKNEIDELRESEHMPLSNDGAGVAIPSPEQEETLREPFSLRDNNPNSTTYSSKLTTGWTTTTFTIPEM